MQPTTIVGVVIVLVILAVIAYVVYRTQQRSRLRDRFGPEYDRARDEYGSKADQVLAKRKEKVDKLDLRPLQPAVREEYAQRWRDVQAEFVDDPRGAITQADRLIGEVMNARGYPVGNFEQRADLVSVDHPNVVEHYRAAHRIAGRGDDAGTEDLRQAMVHYRALYRDLLETPREEPVEEREEVRR